VASRGPISDDARDADVVLTKRKAADEAPIGRWMRGIDLHSRERDRGARGCHSRRERERRPQLADLASRRTRRNLQRFKRVRPIGVESLGIRRRTLRRCRC